MTDLSDEDKLLLRQYLKGVKPLKTKKTINQPKFEPAPRPKSRTVAEDFKQPNYYLSDFISEEVESETVLAFCRPNFSNQQFKLLKSGKIPFQAILDLHGETVATAEKALTNFIFQASIRKLRSVLIIHGKHSYNSKPPVLKNLVNQWLKQIPLVLAFHSALAKNGGKGAVYVYLGKAEI